MTKKSLILQALVALLLVAFGIWVLFAFTPIGSIIVEALSYLVQTVWSPFILEATLFLFGIIVVLTINLLRSKSQDDEYVYLAEVDPEEISKDLPETVQHRLGSAVFKEKPTGISGDALNASAVDGMLELGDFKEAGNAVMKMESSQFDSEDVLRLRLRLCLMQGQWSEAEEVVTKALAADISHSTIARWHRESAASLKPLNPSDAKISRCLLIAADLEKMSDGER